MARWNRAARLVGMPSRSRVLDLGCAFGFGTRMLLPRYAAYGHDLDADYVRRARTSVRSAVFTHGPAHFVPYEDGFFDAVLLLDVLEHVPNERAVVDEIERVLRRGGKLIVSVPNDGLLARWDSLNVYRRLFGGSAAAPTDDPSWSASPHHQHYSIDAIRTLFDPAFTVRSVHYTGLGIAEPLNLILLALFRAVLPMRRAYNLLQYLYFGVYLAEDMLPTGDWGYHMMVELERK